MAGRSMLDGAGETGPAPGYGDRVGAGYILPPSPGGPGSSPRWRPLRHSRRWRRLAWAGDYYRHLVIAQHRETGEVEVRICNGCLMGEREVKPGESIAQVAREMAEQFGLGPALVQACLRKLAKAEQERV